MEISKALELYEVVDIQAETEKTLNKKFKQLSKKYHPDVYKDDGTAFKEVKSALESLLDLLKQVNLLRVLNRTAPEEKLIYITFKELLQIYSGVSSSVSKSDLHKNRVYILISVDTLYKNDIKTFTTVNTWNVEDRYNIDIELEDTDISSKSEVDIRVLKYNKHVELNYKSTKFVATLDNDIKLSINITKKLKK